MGHHSGQYACRSLIVTYITSVYRPTVNISRQSVRHIHKDCKYATQRSSSENIHLLQSICYIMQELVVAY